MAAPLVWILLALLDGKCFVCAFSNSVDPEKFLDFANMTPSQVQLFLAKVPCKEDELVRDSPARKAVSRYLRCLSQVIGVLPKERYPASVWSLGWSPHDFLRTLLTAGDIVKEQEVWGTRARSGQSEFLECERWGPQDRHQIPLPSQKSARPSPRKVLQMYCCALLPTPHTQSSHWSQIMLITIVSILSGIVYASAHLMLRTTNGSNPMTGCSHYLFCFSDEETEALRVFSSQGQ